MNNDYNNDCIVWDDNDRAPEMARLTQEKWGGHVFVSTSRPGFAAWFSMRWTPSRTFQHPVLRSIDGILNPPREPSALPAARSNRWLG